jgi:hypothetical protein
VRALSRGLLRVAAIGSFVVGIMLATASPAAAHGVGGVSPTDYTTRIVSVTPAVDGLTLRTVDLGQRFELTNRGTRDVVVLGYDGEPYLRVGPRGVFENSHSPATYLNRSFTPTGRPPTIADPTAPPAWHRTSAGHTVRWHDHRAHYMGIDDPPVVQRDRSHRHVVQLWEIDLRRGSTTIVAKGDVVWVPPPSPWPWLVLAAALAVGVFFGTRGARRARFVAPVLATLIAAETLHVIGLWGATTASTGSLLLQSAYSAGGIVIGLVALVWVARRGAVAAAPGVLVAALFLLVAGGLADIPSLSHSQIPTTFSPAVTRTLVTVLLGGGAGLAITAALRLRLPPAATVTSRGAPVPTPVRTGTSSGGTTASDGPGP